MEVNIEQITTSFSRVLESVSGIKDISGHPGLVANTCNRSEDYVGYSTKYGDAAGDFSPLAGFTVREVLQLGHALSLPEQLLTKAPADGLSGMSDEKKLAAVHKDEACRPKIKISETFE